jgi:ribosomal protein S18 acetylase RimI-like enzyme
VFRLSARADPAFLTEMLYEAVYWRDESADERPALDAMLADPQIAGYVTGWGREGDVALCALDPREEPVGAAWYRRFSAAAPGYGYVADDIPELSIGVYPECRRERIGSLLIGALVARAGRDRQRAVSLSVNRENPAKRLYARNGFEIVAQSGDSLTMLVDLS